MRCRPRWTFLPTLRGRAGQELPGDPGDALVTQPPHRGPRCRAASWRPGSDPGGLGLLLHSARRLEREGFPRARRRIVKSPSSSRGDGAVINSDSLFS